MKYPGVPLPVQFFSSRTAGPKPSYSLCLVVDTSLSMHEHLGHCAVEVLLVMLSALAQINLGDSTSIITFGSSVNIIKSEEQSLEDPAVIHTLLSSLRFDDQMASMDGDALRVALDLLSGSAKRTAKKVFVLTDGYGTSGLRLQAELQRAEDLGVDVVAIAVGFDDTNVGHCYPRWVKAALPEALPDALRELYLQDSFSAAAVNALTAADVASSTWGKWMPMLQGAEGDLQKILDDNQVVFLERLQVCHLYCSLHACGISCCCFRCTRALEEGEGRQDRCRTLWKSLHSGQGNGAPECSQPHSGERRFCHCWKHT
jgi:uncharacterized protein YegL